MLQQQKASFVLKFFHMGSTITGSPASATLIRPLGAFEQMFWLRAQSSTVHLFLAAEIEGATTPGQWRTALDAVQKVHPMLSVGIRQNKDTTLWFEQRPGIPIPLRLVPGESILHWEAELEKELCLPFTNEEAPLIRAVLIHYPDRCIIGLVSHHSISDGLSLSYIVRDLLEILSGRKLTPLPFPSSVDDLLGITVADPGTNLLKGPPLMDSGIVPLRLGEKTKIIPRMYTHRLTPEFTDQLVMRSREEETTLHGALISALVLAGRRVFPKWREKPVRVLSPISVRGLLGVGEECCLSLVAKWMPFAPEENRSFWELARFVRSAVAETARLETIIKDTAGLRKFVDGMDVSGSEQVSERFNRELVVSNIGRVTFRSDFGPLRLLSMWGPTLHSGFEDEFSMAVCTVNGACGLAVTSREKNGLLLLQETVKELTEQCR